MNKIGLQIATCQEGYRSLEPFNGNGAWENKCIDLRTPILSRYKHDDATGKYGVFMRFSKQGSYITIWKFLSGSENDFTAFWLFIPSGTKIEGKEVLGLINKVKDALPTIDEERTQNDIKEQLFKKYETDENAPAPIESKEIPVSGSATLAFRKYQNEKELADLIGNKRCQPYYEEYAAILLTGPNSPQLKNPNDIKDLTKNDLFEYAMLPHPKKLNEQGIKVFIGNSEYEYTTKQQFKIGDEISLIFKKHDREDIDGGKVKFEDPDTFWEKAAADLKWQKKITRGMFNITAKPEVGDEDHASDCVIKINGEKLPKNDYILIPENELSKVHVEITLKHFETVSCKPDLTSKINPINIAEMKEYTHSQYNELENKLEKKEKELKDKKKKIDELNQELQKQKKEIDDLEKKLKEKEERDKNSSDKPADADKAEVKKPDDGNETEETPPDKNRRGKKKAGKICLIIWAAVTTVISVVLAIMLLTGKTLPDLTSVFSNDNATATAALQTNSETTIEANDSAPAINYLKNCDGILFRDSLEHYPYTKGLWDDFNLDKVIGEWAEKLRGRGIQCFEDIAEHAKNCIDKNLLDKAKEKNSGHYNKAEDLKINVENYCNWIDAARDKTTPSNDAEGKYGSGDQKQ